MNYMKIRISCVITARARCPHRNEKRMWYHHCLALEAEFGAETLNRGFDACSRAVGHPDLWGHCRCLFAINNALSRPLPLLNAASDPDGRIFWNYHLVSSRYSPTSPDSAPVLSQPRPASVLCPSWKRRAAKCCSFTLRWASVHPVHPS